MVSFGTRLSALSRRAAGATRPRAVTVIYHPGRPMPPHEPAETVIWLPCNGRAACTICDVEASRP